MRSMLRRQKKMTRGRAQLVIALGVLFLIFPSVTGIRSLRVLRYSWVEGTVLSTTLKSNVRGRSSHHWPVIEYSYMVGNVTYRNDLFNPLNDDGTEKWAREILQQYSLGAVCSVFYNPSDPQEAVLSRTPNYSTVSVAIIFTALGVLHVVGGILAVRRLGRLEVPPVALGPES